MIDVSIHLICSRKPGTLSRLIRDIKLFGLIYSSHDIRYEDNHSLITVHGTGALNCTQEKLIEILNELPEIISITEVNISHNGAKLDQVETKISNELILSHELLSPAILLTAEKRLAEIVGPIAGYLVETAANTSKDTGELFHSLAAELNTEVEQQNFLSIINSK